MLLKVISTGLWLFYTAQEIMKQTLSIFVVTTTPPCTSVQISVHYNLLTNAINIICTLKIESEGHKAWFPLVLIAVSPMWKN